MNVVVLLFAGLKERVGERELRVALDGDASVAALLERLAERHPILNRYPFAIAINGHYASRDASLAEGDEVALIPPVSGGST
jgi:molybdopterin converting factor subunit 1